MVVVTSFCRLTRSSRVKLDFVSSTSLFIYLFERSEAGARFGRRAPGSWRPPTTTTAEGRLPITRLAVNQAQSRASGDDERAVGRLIFTRARATCRSGRPGRQANGGTQPTDKSWSRLMSDEPDPARGRLGGRPEDIPGPEVAGAGAFGLLDKWAPIQLISGPNQAAPATNLVGGLSNGPRSPSPSGRPEHSPSLAGGTVTAAGITIDRFDWPEVASRRILNRLNRQPVAAGRIMRRSPE